MLFTVDGAKCGFRVCVSSVISAALPWVTKKILKFVLSQLGRAKNPALLIFYRPLRRKKAMQQEKTEGAEQWKETKSDHLLSKPTHAA
jgi:hypothetical protein